MAFCLNCGREIPENSIFCNWCGEKQLRERKKKDEIKVPTPTQLPSGNWFIRLRAEGQCVTEPTRELCLARARAIRAGFLEAKSTRSGLTLRAAYDAYIDARTGVLSPSTIRGYKCLERNSFQRLMLSPIDRISSEAIQREVSAMSRGGMSYKSISNAVGLLSSVMKTYAPETRIDVRLPPKEKKTPRKVEEDEIGQIYRAVRGTAIELPVLMGLWLGMRMSEIRGARFEDVKNHKLHICRAIVNDENGRAISKPPKTFSGDRWIDLPPEIEGLIREQGRGEGNIVTLSGHAIYQRFSRILAKNGIEHCRFHDLRHANAAVMVKLGVDSKYAQERNGWASDRMYKQVYAYTVKSGSEDVSARLNNYFANAFANEPKKG